MTQIRPPIKPLFWAGSSKRDFRDFPDRVQHAFGFELFLAQTGQRPPSAKPLKGIAGGTIELVEDFDGDTFRAVYTVRLKNAIYVLHAFKKKSKRGIATPRRDVELIERRMKAAAQDHEQRFGRERS